MSKGESKNIRLDHDLIEAIENMATALSKTDSEIIRWAIRRGLDLGIAPIQINSTLAVKEDLALLMGEVRKLEDVFRHAKSRLTVPRPISAEDEEGLKQWREAQATVDDFFKQAAACHHRLKIVSELLSGLKAEDVPTLRTIKGHITSWSLKQTNPQARANIDSIVTWLSKAGV